VQREPRAGAAESQFLRINHPLELMQVGVRIALRESTLVEKDELHTEFKVLALLRTSQRVMDGKVFIPKDVWNGQQSFQVLY
jgi:2-methylaconitate cis-trans-isomerase PrpF